MHERRNIHKSSNFKKAKRVARMAAKIAMLPVVMISWAVPGGRQITKIANVITEGIITGTALIVMIAWYNLAGQKS